MAKETKKKKTKKTVARREYSKEDLKLLKAHSKSKTPVDRIAKLMKRSGATLRQKARAMVCHSATEHNQNRMVACILSGLPPGPEERTASKRDG